MPITTVADAIAVRDAGIDDREIAIRGWYTPFYPLRACGRFTDKNPLSPLQMGCPERFLWLMQLERFLDLRADAEDGIQ